jgi:heptosyltransferase III
MYKMMSDYPDLSGVKRVLVVRMRHLGDLLLTTPVLNVLKKAIPSAHIDLFINQDSFSLVEGHSAVSRCFLYDRRWKSLHFFKKIMKELKLLLEIRRQNYDLVLNLTEGDRGALIALFSGAPLRVGFDPGKSGFMGKRGLYTHLVKICPHPRHTVERQLDALRRIGIFPSEEERDLTLTLCREALKKVEALLLGRKEFILIHPVSRWLFKSPPPTFFIELIQALHARGESIVLSGGGDRDAMALIEKILLGTQGIPLHSLAGKTDLKELAALISLSRTLITVDSLPLHLASALKRPVIALFGPSSETNWGPWMHPRSRVIAAKSSCRPCYMNGCGGSGRSDCLEKIPITDLLHALDEL